jgi:hypothetical protein
VTRKFPGCLVACARFVATAAINQVVAMVTLVATEPTLVAIEPTLVATEPTLVAGLGYYL